MVYRGLSFGEYHQGSVAVKNSDQGAIFLFLCGTQKADTAREHGRWSKGHTPQEQAAEMEH